MCIFVQAPWRLGSPFMRAWAVPCCFDGAARAQVEEMAEWRRQGEVLSAKEAESASGETYACQQVNSAYQASSSAAFCAVDREGGVERAQ